MSAYPYAVVQVIEFDRSTQTTRPLWELHHPLGYRVATFKTYGNACRAFYKATGKRWQDVVKKSA